MALGEVPGWPQKRTVAEAREDLFLEIVSGLGGHTVSTREPDNPRGLPRSMGRKDKLLLEPKCLKPMGVSRR